MAGEAPFDELDAMWNDHALVALASDAGLSLDAASRRWLRRRGLLSDDSELTIPVLGRWIREEEL